MKPDVTIIGAGIVGLATAYQLSRRRPDWRILIVEKEDGVARHQSGRNSGVIHSGIYYRPGSLRAVNCRKGYRYLLDFCNTHGVPYEICGKVIVAVDEEERSRLDPILANGLANGLSGIRKISPEEVREIEPHVQCLEAIWVPQAGIIDYREVASKYLELLREKGHEVLFNARALAVRDLGSEVVVVTELKEITTKRVINCGGLYSDAISRWTAPDLVVRILPFRGEYYELVKEREYLVHNLIYPLPNRHFPFLGVHFTRMIHGGIEAGPNAVLAFRREGYSRWDIHPRELWEILRFPGFRKLAARYWREGLDEFHRSFSKKAFVRALQRLIPSVTEADLHPGRAGVRAMACDPQGYLLDDFLILRQGNVINVANAPSPAATASLAIGETIVERVELNR